MEDKLHNTIEPQACLHCSRIFQPKRRWIQKYCCESCRTMACQQRKNGIGGTRETKRRSTSVTDLSKVVAELHQSTLNQMFALQNELLIMKLNFEAFNRGVENNSEDIKRKIDAANEIQLMTVKAKFESIQIDIIQQKFELQIISNNQSNQQWMSPLFSTFGPKLGALLWDTGKELLTGNKIVNTEEKLKQIMEMVKELKQDHEKS